MRCCFAARLHCAGLSLGRVIKENELPPRTRSSCRAIERGATRLAKSMVQRYLIAALGFAVAAAWLGVGLAKGLECLVAFLLTSLVVSVVQARRRVLERSRRRRPTTSAHRHARRRTVTEGHERRSSRHPERRPRLSATVYDDDDSVGWPQLADRYR
jgi:hypothetical protein